MEDDLNLTRSQENIKDFNYEGKKPVFIRASFKFTCSESFRFHHSTIALFQAVNGVAIYI